MTSDDHAGNLIVDAAGHAAGRAAETAAAIALATQAAMRIRERRLAADTAREGRQEAVMAADRAAARLVWSAATRPEFVASASGPEAARVWAASQPWAEVDPAAAEALRRAEARLAEVAPELVADYRQRVATGEEPATAMWAAGAAGLARAEVGHQRGAAAAGFATPDVPRTRLDEHQVGVTLGEAHGAVADEEAARAARLAGIAYPQPISAALNQPLRSYRPTPGPGRTRGRSR